MIHFLGWTRKSITFSIDDGDIPNDIKFLDIVRPAGILGTFNISSPIRTTHEHYRELYRGYEIANHCAHHPLLMMEEQDFNIPEDKTHWLYTVRESNLLSGMKLYENYPDDENLKVIVIGVHARDYERNEKWDDLRSFAEIYGNRPDDYYYAINIDINEYEAAVKSLIIGESTVENPTDKDIYMTVLGERVILKAKSKISY